MTLENDRESSTFTLPDGRKLGYAEYGSSTGRPIILLHGFGCSRYDGAHFDEVGKEVGARVIGVDRPGMGLSSPLPNWTVLEFAKDVEHLTDHLELDGYCVMVSLFSDLIDLLLKSLEGISGGGPTTLACAKALPQTRLKAVAMIVAIGPPDIGMSGAQLANRLGFPYGLRYCPTFLFRWFWQRDAVGRVDLSDEERLKMMLDSIEKAKSTIPAKDLPILSDPGFWRIALKSTREGLVQGFDKVLQDGQLYCYDFGFKVEDIRSDLPVHLWYGKHDVNVPPNHGVQLAKRLGSRAELRLEDETHIGVTVNCKREILENLIKAM